MRTTWLSQPRYSMIHFGAFTIIVAGTAVIALGYYMESVVMPRVQTVTDALLETPLPDVVAAPSTREPDPMVYRKPYQFGRDVFTMRLPAWRQILGPLQGKPGLNYLEVGLFEGRSAIWMLENILTDPTARMTGVDIFEGELRDRYFRNLQLSGAADKVTTINQPSQIALRTLPLESFDIIYIDGSHVKCDVLEDAVLSWRLLKSGGLLIFDDYQHVASITATGLYEAPKVAIDAFFQCFDHRCEVIHNEWQVILRKKY